MPFMIYDDNSDNVANITRRDPLCHGPCTRTEFIFYYMPSAGDVAISSSSQSYLRISSILVVTLFISQKSVCPDTKAWAFIFC